MMLIVLALKVGPISIIQSSNFTQKTSGLPWLEKNTTVSGKSWNRKLDKISWGGISYLLCLLYQGATGEVSWAELLGNFPHDQALPNCTLDFYGFFPDGLNMVWKKICSFFKYTVFFGGYSIHVKLQEHILCTLNQVSSLAYCLLSFSGL